MRPLERHEIKGTWGTLLLPIAEDDSIDWVRLEDEIEALIASGVDGIYSNGTACEFYSQSEAEFDRIQDTLASRCERGGIPFQIGANHTSAQTMLERVRRARELHPGAVQVILPDWYPLTPGETQDFLEKVAEAASPVRLVVYNPPHAKRILDPAEWAALAKRIPGLAGVKVMDRDATWYTQMRATGLSVFVPGNHLATGFALGAAGSYSNVACLSPAGAKAWNIGMRTDLAAALELEQRIQVFMNECVLPFRERQGIANSGLDKLLAFAGGWTDVGLRLRWPYRWIGQADAIGLRKMVRDRLPELFSQ